MPDRWEISPEFPEGRWVPLTPEEEADREASRVAGEAASAAAALEAGNDKTIRDRLEAALANLEAANTNWGTLTAAQKDAALRLGIRADAGLIRLFLHRLDTAG